VIAVRTYCARPLAARLPALLLALAVTIAPSAAPAAPAAPAAAGAAASAASAPPRVVPPDAQAQYDRALVALCRRRPAVGVDDPARLLRSAAEQGHTGAQSVLGWMLMSGHRVPRDDAHAAGWLRRAAQGGDTAAQNNLGVLYATGSGVPRDLAAAERWFRAAADRGAEMAEQNLQVLRGGAASRPAPRAAAALHPALAAAGCRAGPRT
jgi:TPR repeat protein